LLIIAAQRSKSKVKQVVTTLPDDSTIEQAIELAKSVMVHNKIKSIYIYIKHNGDKPVLLKKISLSWNRKVKVR